MVHTFNLAGSTAILHGLAENFRSLVFGVAMRSARNASTATRIDIVADGIQSSSPSPSPSCSSGGLDVAPAFDGPSRYSAHFGDFSPINGPRGLCACSSYSARACGAQAAFVVPNPPGSDGGYFLEIQRGD